MVMIYAKTINIEAEKDNEKTMRKISKIIISKDVANFFTKKVKEKDFKKISFWQRLFNKEYRENPNIIGMYKGNPVIVSTYQGSGTMSVLYDDDEEALDVSILLIN